jgi:hypothetical protein
MCAQSPGVPVSSGTSIAHPQIFDPVAGFPESSIAARQIKLLNIQRQKIIVEDTEKILQLARELNADANSGGATLTQAERIQKADEIAKLAKSVRERMVYAIGLPEPPNPFSPAISR